MELLAPSLPIGGRRNELVLSLDCNGLTRLPNCDLWPLRSLWIDFRSADGCGGACSYEADMDGMSKERQWIQPRLKAPGASWWRSSRRLTMSTWLAAGGWWFVFARKLGSEVLRQGPKPERLPLTTAGCHQRPPHDKYFIG